MNRPIQVTRSSMPPMDEYTDEIKDLWDTHWLTNMGVKHHKLEQMLKNYLKTPYITLFTNGHLALECIFSALKLTGEVITTPFTFASTTHAIVRTGLKPVFCDIREEDCTIDPDRIESLITKNTCAIVPIHVYGNLCDTERIEEIARKYNLNVVYDAAHAFGVSRRGKSSACFGDASMFSFHATKVFNTIEGGAVTFGDESLIKILDDLKNFGITGPETVEYAGGNAKMNEFQAAMGICNLRHVGEEIAKRRKVYEKYLDNLDGIKHIKIIKPSEDIISNYAYFPVIFDGYRYSRDEVFELLKENHIYARKYFYPITSAFECYRGVFEPKKTPVALEISKKVLTLPMYADLSMEEVDSICSIILNKSSSFGPGGVK